MKLIKAIITLAVAGIVFAGCSKEPSKTSKEIKQFTDLSTSGTANCYIVSEAGNYKFNAAVKGNSTESVGTPESAVILWESFGTAETPSKGDLLKNVTLKDGYVMFEASSKKGNAVIAVKNSSGTILWSWHIWLTDQPQGQEYYNNSGTMMDRNLGAVSTTPGDDGTCGLIYQWGRKDPFLGGNGRSGSATATLGSWATVSSDSSNGTIEYSVENPTTFITDNSSNHDWYFTGDSNTDDTRWQSSKTIYDPCPHGWRIPCGGFAGIWASAFGKMGNWTKSSNWNGAYRGMDFGSTDVRLGTGTIWYPATDYRNFSDGSLNSDKEGGYYWSYATNNASAYLFYFINYGTIYPLSEAYRAYGYSVRCVKEYKQ